MALSVLPEPSALNHIQSEQRRANIRRGYEALCDVVPALRDAIREGEALSAMQHSPLTANGTGKLPSALGVQPEYLWYISMELFLLSTLRPCRDRVYRNCNKAPPAKCRHQPSDFPGNLNEGRPQVPQTSMKPKKFIFDQILTPQTRGLEPLITSDISHPLKFH
jgi:hypothetical protein